MLKGKNTKKEKRKTKIKELAEIATEKINQNKLLLETLSLYQSQINIIQKILDKRSKISINNNNNNSNSIETTNIATNSNVEGSNINAIIKNDFLLYYQQLKKCTDNLKEVNKKLLHKYEMNNNIIFDDSSLTKIDLNKNRIDVFILEYDLKQKNDIIKTLNNSLINARNHTLFREIRRETEINRNTGTNYLNTDNLYLQRDLQYECKQYNKCRNRIKKKQKNIEKYQKAEKYLAKIIQYFDKEKSNNNNKNNKKIFMNKNKKKESNKKLEKNKQNNKFNDFNSITINELDNKYHMGMEVDLMDNNEENNNKEKSYLPGLEQINSMFYSSDNLKLGTLQEKERQNKVKQEFNFLTVDELFNLDNEEGEKEIIIQEELHSDDEVIFEKKIKNKNRINTNYITDIKKQVPHLYLNQIEFNKKKVMNEADLYSFQRREYNKQNIDENINTMKKKIKIMKKRVNINEQKLNALINFDKKAKEQYKVLKPIKVLSSMKDYNISFMKKEFYNYKSKKNNNDIIKEVDEKNYATQANNKVEFGEDDSDDDFDDYSDKMRKNNKNNIVITEADYEEKNKYGKKYLQYDDYNEDKAKSK